MKKIFFTSCLTMLSIFSYAQSQFEMKLTENTAKLEKATTAADFDILFSEFSSLIKFNDKNKWKAYYYAGFTQYKKADILLKSSSFADAKNRMQLLLSTLKLLLIN